jgi:hypothetical protein
MYKLTQIIFPLARLVKLLHLTALMLGRRAFNVSALHLTLDLFNAAVDVSA